MFGEILPIVTAGINVRFMRNVPLAENFIKQFCAGFKSEIVLISTIEINFQTRQICFACKS